jgi:hypothetical protein
MEAKSTHTYERSSKMYVPEARNAGTKTYTFIRTFKPLPWQVEPWADTSDIMLLSGSAGGGKSVLAGEKVHGYCLKYPNTTALVTRKTKDSMINSTVLQFEKTIIGKDPRVIFIRNRDRFEYSNGSILAFVGMNDPKARERIRSFGATGGIDIAWMEEATEFEEEDFNEINARMRGTAAPWRQLIMTTNPDGPAHWIHVRIIIGGRDDENIATYYSGAVDNPYLPDTYRRSLERLTGVQYQRLVLGKWVLGSGVIFDTWLDQYNASTGKDGNGNVTEDAEYQDGNGLITWAVDDGYSGKMDKKTRMFTGKSHPRAILVAQIRQDGTIAVIDESYEIETLAEDHLRAMLRRTRQNGIPDPTYVIRDRAAASVDGAAKAVGLKNVKFNRMDVDESIKEMRSWIAPDHNKVRRIIAHPRCRYLRYEMAQYSMNKEGRIIKEHDNGVDALRYLCWDKAYGRSPVVDIVSWSMVAGR